MDAADLVDQMSPSKLDLWEKCPQAWAYRYLHRLRGPKGPAQALGNAVDAVANAVYWHKLQSGETASADDAAERFAEWHELEAGTVETWDDDEPRGAQLDRGVRAVRHWRDLVAVRVQPATEPQVRLEFTADSGQAEQDAAAGIGSTFRVVTITDLVADVPAAGGGLARVVVDHKASGKRWNEADALRSSQAPCYRLATGVARFQWHVLRTDLVRPQTLVVATETTDTMAQHLVHRMALARRGIATALRTGDWHPRRNQTLCTRRWCPHWRECERDHGGRVTL